MSSPGGGRFFRRRPIHQKREWDKKHDNHSEDEERHDKYERTCLHGNHRLKLRNSFPPRIRKAVSCDTSSLLLVA
jgi:hypothetical protein